MSIPTVDIENDAATAAATLDALSGNVLVLAGETKPDAQAIFDAYVAETGLIGVAHALQFRGPAVYFRFCWECDIGEGQDQAIPLEWDHILIEDRLFPEKELTDVLARRIAVTAELRDIADAPVAAFDFTAESLPAGVSLTRASTAYYWDATPALQSAAVDEARFERGALLVEPAAEELMLDTVASDTTYSIGAGTYYELNENLYGLFPVMRIESNETLFFEIRSANQGVRPVVADGDTVTLRLIYRVGTSGALWLRFREMSLTNDIRLDGPAGNLSLFEASFGANHQIENIDRSGGIYEVAITFDNDSGSAFDVRVGIGPFSETLGEYVDAIAVTATVDGVASSYIHTTGSAATRAADVPAIDGLSGTYDVRVTFDDDSTQDLLGEVIGADYWPAGLNRNRIKSIHVYEDGEL